MDVFKNTNKSKKFIIIIIAIMLFSFAIPKPVQAWSLKGSLSDLFFWVERGVIKLVNNIFCDERHQYEYDEDDTNNTKIYISPETIIKGKFALLDANIFKEISAGSQGATPEEDDYYDTHDTSGGILDGTAVSLQGIIAGKNALRETISGWYYALRNLAIIALLSILVYVGIRMILSTISQDKAKYKTMFKDWLVALCLVMVMHYMMIAILNITSEITEAIGTSGHNDTTMQKLITRISKINNEGSGDDHEITIDGKLYTIGDAFAYELVLLGVIGYTIIFAIKYLIRMMTIVFLILVAPITAITYPIDKISDGKAQAFNMWFQEFLYEVIIQPFHLLIYIVLVGSATTLAETNWMYSVMCFAVMIPAEKFVKQMFGFKDKLGSPLGAFAGGAVASQLMSKAFSGGGSSAGDKGPKVEGKSDSDDGFRENKLKPGMPGADQGTGEPTTYDNHDGSGTEDSEENGPGGASEETNPNEDENDGPQREVFYPDGYEEEKSKGTNPNEDENGEPQKEVFYPDGYEEEKSKGTNPNEDENGAPQRETFNSHGDEEADSEPEQEQKQEKEPPTKGIYTPNSNSFKKQMKSAWTNKGNAAHALREHNDKRRLAKYGTTHRGLAYIDKNGNLRRGAAGKYLGKKASKFGKRAIKGALTLGAGALAGVVGTMFGQGGKAALAGAAVGLKMSNKINDKASSAYSTAKEYGREALYATKDEDQRRREKVDEDMAKPKQRDLASRGFSKRNNGRIATKEELENELAERARFKETGLTDSQIDDAMEIYHDNIDKLGDEKAFEMAYSAANISDRYSAADFEDPKKMKNAYDSLMRQYEALGVNQDLADENVRAILGNAAAAKHVKQPALPQSRKDAYKADKDNKNKAAERYGKRHKDASGNPIKPNKKQQDHELEMGYNLRRAGISEADSNRFFDEYLTDETAWKEAKDTLDIKGDDLTEEQEMMVEDELERRFEVKIKTGMTDARLKQEAAKKGKDFDKYREEKEKEITEHMKGSRKSLEENMGIKNPTSGQIFGEVKHRLQIKDSYHVSNSEVDAIRRSEEEFVKKSTDKAGARAVIEAQRAEARKAISKIEGSEALRPEDKAGMMESMGREKLRKAEYQRKLFSTYSRAELKDDKNMDKFAKKVIKEVTEANGSTDYGRAFAVDIINSTREMAGLETGYSYTDI